MKAIRFEVKGVFNSFRIPFFRTYHKTFLAPPKTTIIGLLANVLRKPEKWFYEVLEKELVDVSVVIKNIEGRAKDLWAYKTLESKSDMHGRSVIRRDKLFGAAYTIYLRIHDEDLYVQVKKGLRYPEAIPCLGLDDEIIAISDVEEIEMLEDSTGWVDSVFMDFGKSFTAKVRDENCWMELPTGHLTPFMYKKAYTADGRRKSREAGRMYKQIEYVNCLVEVKEAEVYTDGVSRVVFY